MTTVAVDFDGVVHAYSRGWQDGSIYDGLAPGALDALRRLMSAHAVFIFTSRDPVTVSGWLNDHGLPARAQRPEDRNQSWTERGLLYVTNRKLLAVAYIDDLAIRFTSWEQALADLEKVLS